ncbi:MAG: hypothetical protein AB7U99_07865, partial [Steroidobacteraceae bacterium]
MRGRELFYRWSWLLMVLTQWLFCGSALASASDARTTSLHQNWSYHWGDLPRNNTDSNWDWASTQWHAVASPAVVPGRQQQQLLWLKLQLPQGSWRDPSLFISSIDLSAQVFDSHSKLYQFGEFDTQGRSRFAGWPWHLIDIPTADIGQTIYFRVFSDYTDIGLSGEVLLGERADLLQRIYSRGFIGLVAVLVVFIVGLIGMCLGLIKRDRGVALATGALSFDLALMMFAENELSQVVYFAPLLWRQVAAYSYFVIPALLAWVLREWFRKSHPISLNLVITVTLLYVFGVIMLSALSEFNFVAAYPIFDALFIVLVLLLLVDSARHIGQVGLEGALVAFGMLTVFISLLVDMASSHGFITWIGRAGQWGLVFFALSSLAVYLVRDWRQQIELHRFKHVLERQVEERTSELVASQQRLQQLANEDGLTGLLNRRAFMS